MTTPITPATQAVRELRDHVDGMIGVVPRVATYIATLEADRGVLIDACVFLLNGFDKGHLFLSPDDFEGTSRIVLEIAARVWHGDEGGTTP